MNDENQYKAKITGLLRPLHCVDAQDDLIPLHPGRTWIHLVSPFSPVASREGDQWLVRFVQP